MEAYRTVNRGVWSSEANSLAVRDRLLRETRQDAGLDDLYAEFTFSLDKLEDVREIYFSPLFDISEAAVKEREDEMFGSLTPAWEWKTSASGEWVSISPTHVRHSHERLQHYRRKYLAPLTPTSP